MISKVSRKSISNGLNKFKNLIAQINYYKDNDINIHQIGYKLTKLCNNGLVLSKFIKENLNSSIANFPDFKTR